MKKIIKLMVILIFSILLMPLSSVKALSNDYEFGISYRKSGNYLTVTYKINKNPGLSAIQSAMYYDISKLEFVDTSYDNSIFFDYDDTVQRILPSDVNTNSDNEKYIKYQFITKYNSNVTDTGELFRVKFKIIDSTSNPIVRVDNEHQARFIIAGEQDTNFSSIELEGTKSVINITGSLSKDEKKNDIADEEVFDALPIVIVSVFVLTFSIMGLVIIKKRKKKPKEGGKRNAKKNKKNH